MVRGVDFDDESGEGDTLEDPTQRFQYDPLRYARTGGKQPVFAHALAREEHGAANKRWLETYSYSDGSGREAMTRSSSAIASARSPASASASAQANPMP